jgi:outer membrane protein OmpA-like peptidoglycan-associated protein
LVVGSLLGGGCTAGTPPVALEQARTAYAQAEQTPAVVANAPVPLREANQALQRAERVWADDHDTEEVQHLAALATQRVEIAKSAAEKKVAEAQIQQATEDRDQVLLDARTREAQRSQVEAARATQQAQVATSQAQAATSQVQQLQQELAALQAKQTDRGLVLTLGDVLFETGKADLRPGALRNLYPLVTFLQKYPERRVVIEGHTDSVGSDTYNLDLSERRADAVRDFLLQNGVNAAQMSTRGYGKASPVASNDTAEGRQQNRRVELIIS